MARLLRPSRLQWARSAHSSTPARNLVGPPDPVSHIRPVIYDDLPPKPPPSLLRHPYSLFEFDPSPNRGLGADDLRWKIQRQLLDDFNQDFWLDSNTRFEAAKDAILSSLPSTATPLDKERALSEFYKQWVTQEQHRLEDYTQEWRARNFSSILMATRVAYQRSTSRLWRKIFPKEQ